MPANQSLGCRATRRLDTAIRQIDVATGPLVLTTPDTEVITLAGGERKSFDPPLAGMVAYAPDGSRFHVTYETDPVDTEASRDQVGEKPKPRKRSAPSKASRGDRHRRASSAAKSSGSKSSGSKSKAKSSGSKSKKSSTRKKG